MGNPKSLDRLSAIPYSLELHNTLDAALFTLDRLKEAAAQALKLEAELESQLGAGKRLDPVVMGNKLAEHSKIFDNLESFLSSWARVSLLLFPASRDAFTRMRGETLANLFGIQKGSILEDRDLRDSWMHHDERMDKAVNEGRLSGGQLFTLSTRVTEAHKRGFLRIVEIDTLHVHYQDRDGISHSTNLNDLRAALKAVDDSLDEAFHKLPMPEQGKG